MNGYKTTIGAGLAILYGIAGLALGLHDSDAAAEFIVNGVIALGIGHKIEKAGAK